MLKLLKYEMRKTLMAKLILLGVTAFIEAYFLYSVYGNQSDDSSIAIMLLIVTAVLGIFYIGIQSIITLHHDMNTKQSYMLFMTPHNNYAILGAKALECTLSTLLAGLFFFGLALVDIRLLFGTFGTVKQLISFANQLMETINARFALTALNIAALSVQAVASWLETVMLAFFADVISTSMLKGKKLGGLVTLILFLVLEAMTNKLVQLIPFTGGFAARCFASAAVLMGIAVVVCISTATMMEKKLSV